MAEIQEGRHQRALQREFQTYGAPHVAPELGGVIHPVVIVADTREPTGLAQEVETQFSNGTFTQATPLTNSQFALVNPVASGVLVSVPWFIVVWDGLIPCAWGPGNFTGNLPGAFQSINARGTNLLRKGPNFSAAFFQAAVQNTNLLPDLWGDLGSAGITANASPVHIVYQPRPLIIPPGSNLLLQSFTSSNLGWTICWTEKPLSLA